MMQPIYDALISTEMSTFLVDSLGTKKTPVGFSLLICTTPVLSSFAASPNTMNKMQLAENLSVDDVSRSFVANSDRNSESCVHVRFTTDLTLCDYMVYIDIIIF